MQTKIKNKKIRPCNSGRHKTIIVDNDIICSKCKYFINPVDKKGKPSSPNNTDNEFCNSGEHETKMTNKKIICRGCDTLFIAKRSKEISEEERKKYITNKDIIFF